MAYEFKNHEEFRMKKWIDDEDDSSYSEDIGRYCYLTKSLKNRRKLNKKVAMKKVCKKKEIFHLRQQRRTRIALKYIQKINTPLSRFLNYILQNKFRSYVFVCDSDIEFRVVLNELKLRNIPIKITCQHIYIHIQSFNIRIISRQRFIAGKQLIVAKSYGINFEEFYSLPVM